MYMKRNDPRKHIADTDNPIGTTVSTKARYVGSRPPKHMVPETFSEKGDITDKGFQIKTAMKLRDRYKGIKLTVQTTDFGQTWNQISGSGNTVPLSPRSSESMSSKLEFLRFKSVTQGLTVHKNDQKHFHTGLDAPKKPDYSWPRHNDSDVESDDDSPNIVYRTLRNDEDVSHGIFPKAPQERRTVSQHVSSGSKKPSQLVSMTRSKRVAFKWALESSSKRVAKVKLHKWAKRMDLTSEENRNKVINGATTRNFAKSSKEVLFPGRIPKKRIIRTYQIKVNPKQGEVSLVRRTRKARQKKKRIAPTRFGF